MPINKDFVIKNRFWILGVLSALIAILIVVFNYLNFVPEPSWQTLSQKPGEDGIIPGFSIEQLELQKKQRAQLQVFAHLIVEFKNHLDQGHFNDADKVLNEAVKYRYLGQTVEHDLTAMISYRDKVLRKDQKSLKSLFKRLLR